VLDDAIAALFGVETRRLNEQVRRNLSGSMDTLSNSPPKSCEV